MGSYRRRVEPQRYPFLSQPKYDHLIVLCESRQHSPSQPKHEHLILVDRSSLRIPLDYVVDLGFILVL